MKKVTFLLILFLILGLYLGNEAFAGFRPSFGGEYTNLCGSGTSANFYSCSANCDINTGRCSSGNNQWIFVYVCNGRQIECRNNEIKLGPGSNAYVANYANTGSDKTVQIDVFNKDCRSGGGWSCNDSNLLGYIVWWSGSSGGQVQCNENEVQLSVIPQSASINEFITFKITAGDASTWWRNEFSGGVTNCTETVFGWETRCRASAPGTFTWTRIWKHCVGNSNNCSQECRKSTSFTIESFRLPVVVTLPPKVVTY